MLKRVYVDNFKCLLNFELNLESENIFVGESGSGKSTVLEVLSKLQKFIVSGEKINNIFNQKYLTRWQNKNVQSFEISTIIDGEMYNYALELYHDLDKKISRINKESLFLNNNILFNFSVELNNSYLTYNAYMYNDSLDNKQSLFCGLDHSGLSIVPEMYNNKKLIRFKEYLSTWQVVKINIDTISSESSRECSALNYDTSNYFSWLRYLSQSENRSGFRKLENTLPEIIKGFEIFNFPSSGDVKIFELDFENKIRYRFDELSDGQKYIIILYTLMYCSAPNSIICIDGPDNYIVYDELKSFIHSLHDRCKEKNIQVILVPSGGKIKLTSWSNYIFSMKNGNCVLN